MPQAPEVSLPLGAKVTFLVVAGPTASGKTDLAVALAREISGEVISADSRQLYRGLDAGTAKPRLDSLGRTEGIPYHLVDCLDPEKPADAGLFAELAGRAAAEIRGRGRLPIVAGGTGLYIKALVNGLDPLPRADPALRARLAEEAKARGKEALHGRLAQADPESARRIPAANVQRVARALEVHELTGKPFSSFLKPRPPAPGVKSFVIDWPADALRERIAARAQAMWPAILAEVKALTGRYTGQEPGFQSLGYPEAFACLRGDMTQAQGLESLIRSTNAYAKRQRTWFRHQLDAEPIPGGAVSSMLRFIIARL